MLVAVFCFIRLAVGGLLMVMVLQLGFQITGSVVDVTRGLICCAAHGIFLDQGFSLCVPCIGWWTLNRWTQKSV